MAITYDVLTKREQRDIIKETLRSLEREHFMQTVTGVEHPQQLEDRITDLQGQLDAAAEE